jgi:hypothetical protein
MNKRRKTTATSIKFSICYLTQRGDNTQQHNFPAEFFIHHIAVKFYVVRTCFTVFGNGIKKNSCGFQANKIKKYNKISKYEKKNT